MSSNPPLMFLTAEEIRRLTGRARRGAQAIALKRMGLRFTLNAVGDPIVARCHVEKRLNGTPTTPEPDTPNFAALASGA